MKRILSFLLCMVAFIMLGNAQTSLVNEGFESFKSGNRFIRTAQAAGNTNWRTWSGQLGAADAMISDEQAQEGSLSLKLTKENDIVLLLGDKPSGKYEISFYIYVPKGKDAYFNLLHSFDVSNSEWKTEVYLNHELHMNSVLVDGLEKNFKFNCDTWTKMRFLVDIDANFFAFSVDDNDVATWAWNTTESGVEGLSTLGAIDFYAPSAGDTSVFYIDNVQYTELRAPGAPLFAVYPESINQTLRVGQSATQNLTLTNIGTYKGDWKAWVKYDVEPGEDTNMVELKYDVNYPDTLKVGDNGIGWNVAAANWEVGNKFTGKDYAENALGMYVTKARFYNRVPVADSTITFRAYGMGETHRPGELLSEVTVEHVRDSVWVEGVFPDTIFLNGEDIWITASFTQTKEATYPVSCDFGPMHENASYCRVLDRDWCRLPDLNPMLSYNFAVRAVCEGKSTNGSWLTLGDKTSGTVNSNAYRKVSEDITLNFDAKGVEPGVYTANVIIATNDSTGKNLVVPCTITVLPDSGCLPPTNFAVKVVDSNIELSWTAEGDSTMYKIYRNDELIDSVVASSYVDSALANGNYCYYVTTACDEESAPTTTLCAYLNVGIKDYEKMISIYPNPVQDVLHVSADSYKEVSIFNMMGQQVYRQNITNNHFQINVSNLQSGVYFLRLEGENSVVKKFIKQ